MAEDTTPSDADIEKILSTYYPSIRVPSEKPEKLFILCPVGLPGAGKTTVIKPLAEALSLVRISTDDIRHVLKDENFGYGRIVEMTTRVIEDFLGRGYSVAIDADCGSLETQERIRLRSEEFGAKPIWINVAPPEAFIINKLRTFKHTWLFKDGDVAVANYQSQKARERNLNLPFAYTFDTSHIDLPTQIEEAKGRIQVLMAQS